MINKEMIDQLEQQLKGGIQIAVAPQLFPTPPALARRAVALADICPGDKVLEPEHGTGNIAAVVREVIARYAIQGDKEPVLFSVEINAGLCDRARRLGYDILQADFLSLTAADIGFYDVIVMNPPFKNGEDIKHIMHALTLLNPEGTLVAICANGPRQRAQLMDLCDHWEDLPAGSFKDQGTNVNTALLVIRK